ncbi:MAG: hypothetical protein V4683_18780 [Bacteroidota bacterium]
MKTEQEINVDILNITMMINEQFPELSKYLVEMPITIPNDSSPDITLKILKDYYDSLEILMIDYSANHSNKNEPNLNDLTILPTI